MREAVEWYCEGGSGVVLCVRQWSGIVREAVEWYCEGGSGVVL